MRASSVRDVLVYCRDTAAAIRSRSPPTAGPVPPATRDWWRSVGVGRV